MDDSKDGEGGHRRGAYPSLVIIFFLFDVERKGTLPTRQAAGLGTWEQRERAWGGTGAVVSGRRLSLEAPWVGASGVATPPTGCSSGRDWVCAVCVPNADWWRAF